jgi:hypothetical protein
MHIFSDASCFIGKERNIKAPKIAYANVMALENELKKRD